MANDPETAPPPATLIAWQEGIGDERRYHIAHASSAGLLLVCKLKEHGQWETLVNVATNSPAEAATLLGQQATAAHFTPSDLSKATYAKDLNQLWLFDRNGKKTKIPEGKEQAEVFAAIQQYLGGDASEEEADAWSVMQSPLFCLAVIAVLGGFFIWFTTISDPNYQPTGRKQGMKVMMNWIGYTVGPFWSSLIVGSLAALVLGMMVYQLIKRPIRQVLTYA